MSIKSRMTLFTAKTRSETLDTYGQAEETLTDYKDIEIDITVIDKAVDYYSPKFKDGTHIGLTSDKGLLVGMYLVSDDLMYRIQSVDNLGRLTQVILKEDL
jgi:hypothetical protein